MVDPRAVVVARRAAELGPDLPDDLALWRLAGGRPEMTPRDGDPDALGELLESTLSDRERQVGGAHYTPRPLATQLVARAIGDRRRPTVGDPSCGGGALLLAAARHLAARGEQPADIVGCLWGMDIDPLAVATTEAALALWAGRPPPPGHLVVGDALVERPTWPRLDVVVGNPPFLSQLDADTTRAGAMTERLRARFGDALRAYTDTAGLFLLVACDLAAPGGTVALLEPQSVLAARDAAGVRDAIDQRGRVVEVWLPEDPGFAAAIDVCVPMIEVGGSSPAPAWSQHLARANGVPVVDLTSTRTLGDEATTTAAFRTEYYGMVDHVRERADLPAGRPLVTTGLLDLGGCAWGERSARVGGRTWQAPVLEAEALEGRAADWVRRTGGPKLMVATQTRVVEVVVDDQGEWIAGVPVVVVLAPPDRLAPLAAALAAPAVTAWLLQRAAGTALTPTALKVSAALLRVVPLPTDQQAWQEGTDAFAARDLDAFAVAMQRAYGSDEAVTDWWMARARTVWSPAGARR
jgi:hypothetical protein